MNRHPLIGITADIQDQRFSLAGALARHVHQAGGVPLLLPPIAPALRRFLDLCDGFVFSGGDDPDTRKWGIASHPKATLIDPERQAFELALLEALDHEPMRPVLGICLGMQLMALHAGGKLDQHLPDTLNSAADHWGRREHRVTGMTGMTGITGMTEWSGSAAVHSHHRQAIIDPGHLEVIARAHDGVIEAVRDPARPYYVGVQWHPERTADPAVGAGIFQQLVAAARESTCRSSARDRMAATPP